MRRWDQPRVESIWKLGDKPVRTLGGTERFVSQAHSGKPLRCEIPALKANFELAGQPLTMQIV